MIGESPVGHFKNDSPEIRHEKPRQTAAHTSDNISPTLSQEQTSLLTEHLGLAIKADRFKEALAIWNRLGDHAQPEKLRFFNLKSAYDKSRLHAYVEFEDALLKLRLLTAAPRHDAKRLQAALTQFQKLLEESKNPESKLYLQAWRDLMQMEVDFHDGKWVDLKFDPHFVHWSGDTRQWAFENPTTAVGNNIGLSAGLRLYHFGEFPGPKEVTAEIETLRLASLLLNVGIAIGDPQRTGRLFWVEAKHRTAGIGRYDTPPGGVQLPSPPTQLRVKVWGPEHFDYYINDIPFSVFTRARTFSMRSNQVGLATLWREWMSGIVRIKNVRVRKLTDPQPPALSDSQARVDYYTKLIEREPGFHAHYFSRGTANVRFKQYDQAIADLEHAFKMLPAVAHHRVDLGIAYSQTQQYQKAIEQFEIGARHALGRRKTSSQRLLAHFLAVVPDPKLQDKKRALQLAQQVVKAQQGKVIEGWSTLACAQAANEQFAAALESLDQGAKLNPDPDNAKEIADFRQKFMNQQPVILDAP